MEKLKLSEKGFTIVEIVVAVAILAIMVVSFTQLFTGSFSGIYSAGYKSGSQYTTQEVMENVIAGSSVGGTGINVENTAVNDFNIQFPGGLIIPVPGNEVNVSVSYTDGYGNSRDTTYTSFLPD